MSHFPCDDRDIIVNYNEAIKKIWTVPIILQPRDHKGIQSSKKMLNKILWNCDLVCQLSCGRAIWEIYFLRSLHLS